MKLEDKHFYLKVFNSILICICIIIVFVASAFTTIYIDNERQIRNYSLKLTSQFIGERFRDYHSKILYLFSGNDVESILDYTKNPDYRNRSEVHSTLKNIYAENEEIAFAYYYNGDEMISIGNGIGDIEQRYKIFNEYEGLKDKFSNKLFWRYYENGDERYILFCKDISYYAWSTGAYEIRYLGAVCIGVDIDELSNIVFNDVYIDNQYMCDQYIKDTSGLIVLSTNKDLIGEKAENNMDKNAYVARESEWSLVTYIDENIYSHVNIKYLIIILMVGIATVCIMFLGYYFSKKITKPIDKLYEYINEIDIENSSISTKIETIGDEYDILEIGSIGKKFNEVLLSLEREINNKYLLETNLKDAKLDMYESQLNPHFLFNTLNLIKMMIVLDERSNASKTIGYLGKMLEFSLNKQDKVFLEDEIENIRNYFKIIEFRFKERFKYSIIVDENAQKSFSMKFLIQPFVENAISHGFKDKVDNCEVAVLTKRLGKDVVIVIEDNGCGFEGNKLKIINEALERNNYVDEIGKGIWSVHSIIRLKYGEKYGVSIFSTKGKTQVIVHVPYEDTIVGGAESV